ncbi:bifunctional [glutamine synthetase] adenylyltransferase/[glutamine synthetase]-adenylyl-L-tyrosine phosphorylase [Ancylobacter dichloromethanicus]|uniref:Bifunctional glutamine synthetase adenylyltransferase/adenylyl-removing enzyme n=1 Tax=Ancylobacter dichloromethanicus TaxID=518825 RepID=A0A9W6J5S8_9HYPH|nr:bifunctional [glutamine synthetase] adenylyltransferase/[glutamine synthetase]-adenylyl-L-tyrosine phosphorylase [Ancylobacter dichloromethanicus]MBS7556175.1 bifunctional [glutamine synthetase] adenylyltransferase/[glutamine synthetase]-adenylyl-L-tyrosine phosphorylase [Ancylobacter dichloromethanicus]GLK69929.1 glutamate-ammonia-ligase adenylyltransferase [Ancylobacter dichloromethanicus]
MAARKSGTAAAGDRSLIARLRRPSGYPVPQALPAAVKDAIAGAPKPVRTRIEALLAAHEEARAVLAGVVAHSPFLTDLIRVDPARLAALLVAEPVEALARARAATVATVGAATDEAEVMAALRRLRAETALTVALADIGGVFDLATVTGELTATADAALSAAVDFLAREGVSARKLKKSAAEGGGVGLGYTVLAMGKHGARELNYSSDVDLIVLYDPEIAPLAKDVEAAPFFVRMTQRLVRLIQERTGEGYVARVDLRLRPDPASTPAALSVEAALAYYEREGATWERAAYIKARPVAGDLDLGHDFLKQLAPFVWRRALDYAAIADVHAMKQDIHAFRGHEAIAVEGHNVKLGRGGIREIEFFAQTQQLIAGGRDPRLRTPRTLEALAVLAQTGWIGAAARDELSEAYHFLRRVEHRLQMVADAQTHSLPEDGETLAGFARFMGYEDRAAFAQALVQRLSRVQDHYSKLFEDAPPRAAVEGRLEFPEKADDRETLATLHRLGYAEPKVASATVRGWLAGEPRALRPDGAREELEAVVPLLVDALARGGAPDAGLNAADRFFREMPTAQPLLAALRHNPDLVRLLATILGTAPRLGEMLAHRPSLLDALLDPAFFGALPDEPELAARLAADLAQAEDEEDRLDRARRFRQECHVLIGVRILSGTLPAARAGEAFARLADVLIRSLEEAAMARFREAHGTLPGAELAVLAMGKLGGREMTAGSDLDLIVLYDFDAEHPESDGPRPLYGGQYFARLTQRIVSALTTPTNAGQLYEVDLRLRPSGRSGPVATSLPRFKVYQAEEAWTWEHMALTRARVVAASPGFRSRVEAAIAQVLAGTHETRRLAADIVDMRGAIADEKGDDDPWDLKYARGGLIDIEFIAQYLVLAYAAQEPRIIDTSTLRVVEAAQRVGILDAQDGQLLADACRLLHDLTQVLRLALTGPFKPSEASPALRRLLARAGAMPDFSTLEARLFETQQAVRATFERLLHAEPKRRRRRA